MSDKSAYDSMIKDANAGREEIYAQFVADMETDGWKVRAEYHGRNFYKGPAVDCTHDELQDVIRATAVRVITDSMGLDLIVYPG